MSFSRPTAAQLDKDIFVFFLSLFIIFVIRAVHKHWAREADVVVQFGMCVYQYKQTSST